MKAEFRQPYSKNRKPLIDLLPLKQPLTMYIDPSNACNFKCSFCFQGNAEAKKEMNIGYMKLETFTKVVEQLKEFDEKIKMIHLHGFGEPLLNPNFPTMVKMLKEANVAERIATTSNASLLTKELGEKIIESGLDQIHFSIYGLKDENYKTFSKKTIDFKQLLENVKHFYNLKIEKNSDIHIHIKMNKDYFSQSDQDRFLEIFGNYANSIYLDGVANIWPGIDVQDSLKINLSDESKKEAILTHQYGHTIKQEAICPIVFYQLLIHSNGDISPCCADYQAKMTLGNVENTTIKKAWEQGLLTPCNNNHYTQLACENTGGGGGKLALLRAKHLKGERNTIPVCASCQYPEQAATTTLQEHTEKLKEIYLAPLESINKPSSK